MAVQIARVFSLVFFLSVTTLICFLFWEHSSKTIRWTAFSSRSRGAEKSFEFNITVMKKVENSSAAVTHETGEISVTKLKTEGETPMPVLFKKSFNKLPEWDFEDVYNQDAPPRPRTCAQSLRNSKNENFTKAFLPNIRLFLHKDNINMSEWNRLSHFNNPFGFMEYQHDDVMASVKLIPKPKEPFLLPKPGGDGCVHCAVVGTSGILNGSRMGAEIDAHDYIFRMNGAITKGYEEDVGNRTSVYVHTAHSITMSLYLLKKYGYTAAPHDEGIKYVMIPEGMRDFQWLEGLLKGQKVPAGSYRNKEPRTYYSGQFNESRFYVLHQDFLRYVRNRFLRSKNVNNIHWATTRPTNGAFTLFLALHTCDTVDAYGFMTEDFNKYSNYYVERFTRTKVIFYINHDYTLEKNLWHSLDKSKILRLFQRKESSKETQKPKTQ